MKETSDLSSATLYLALLAMKKIQFPGRLDRLSVKRNKNYKWLVWTRRKEEKKNNEK
jgi:hypothetical protein